jgi:hypothetical protein
MDRTRERATEGKATETLVTMMRNATQTTVRRSKRMLMKTTWGMCVTIVRAFPMEKP